MTVMKKMLIAVLLNVGCYTHCFATENLFYVMRNESPGATGAAQKSAASLKQHYKAINIIAPQAYRIDANGIVWGSINPETLNFAKTHNMKIMPLITNTMFDSEIGHQFLANTNAQKNALKTILDTCAKEHFYGVQFDFEMIRIKDKDALTRFYVAAAKALHEKGFAVSYAIAPLVSSPPFASSFLKKSYVNWEGAYDLKKLGEVADFVSLMAYNQHVSGTTPGTTASARWTEETIKHTLRFIPQHKISLGIPTYSTYWFTGARANGKISVHSVDVDYDKAIYLLKKYNAKLQWDNKEKINFAIYDRHWLNEYLFLEDKNSFAAKNALVNKYKLRGISVFDLGPEDTKIWNVIK